MSKKFSIGDRVRVYAFWIGAGYAEKVGTVVAIENENGVRVKFGEKDCKAEISAHIKQCRRLKPKQREEKRMERWVVELSDCEMSYRTENNAIKAHGNEPKRTHLIELRPGEIIVDRKKLEHAWMNAMAHVPSAQYEAFFNGIGLPGEKK